VHIRASIAGDNSCGDGDQLELVIGAALVAVSEDPLQRDNTFMAQFIGEEFVGSMVTLYFATESGTEIKVQKQQREIDSLSLTDNKQYHLHLDADKVYCLTRTRD